MFDFRYHAISLAAVFLALGLGILLGVTIGDSLVSEADRGLRESLRDDVVEARAGGDEARLGLERREDVIRRTAPLVVDGALAGRRVAIVTVGPLPGGLEASVRRSVERARGRIDSMTVLPADAADLAQGLGITEGSAAARDESLSGQLAEALRGPPRSAERLKRKFPSRFTGPYGGADAVVFHGLAPPAPGADAAQDWEGAVIDALLATGDGVVGVEQSGPTDDSQVPFYADSGIASVDNLDVAAGQIALPLALRAGGEGRYGFKDSADETLPPIPRAVR